MARPLRIEFPGALYHITSRGNGRKKIFRSDQDKIAFLKVLKNITKDYNWICHAYCLMDNHYHLLIETPDGNLSKGMRSLNGVYTQIFNKAHRSVGHIFQGRYKSFLIEKDGYLMEVARYLVLNPVRANIVLSPHLFKWSSYRSTVGLSGKPDWLTIDWILGMFSTNRQTAQKQYVAFIKEGMGYDSPFDKVKGTILGSDFFISHVWDITRGSELIKDIPREQRIVGRPPLNELFSDIKNQSHRNRVIFFARNRFGYSNRDIAHHLDIGESRVSKIIQQEKSKVKT
ncbi:MAG: transposase [Candidatus Uhrbacteria bacterium]